MGDHGRIDIAVRLVAWLRDAESAFDRALGGQSEEALAALDVRLDFPEFADFDDRHQLDETHFDAVVLSVQGLVHRRRQTRHGLNGLALHVENRQRSERRAQKHGGSVAPDVPPGHGQQRDVHV